MNASKFNFLPRPIVSFPRLCAVAALCLLAGTARAQDFSISTLTPNNAVVVDVNALVGDDRGGLAVSGSQVFLSGDVATARFNRDTLGGGASLGVVRDGLVANLADSTVYLLGNASSNALPSGGGTFATLIELNGSTGVPSGNVIALSTPITLTGSSSSVGIFSGWNRVVVHTGTRVYRVSLPDGTVTDLGAMAVPTRTASESWAYWGVAENVGSATRIVYVRNNTTISRTTVPSGATSTVATFANLNDMASFTVSVAQNRWYFHHESSSQFGAFSESLGYADATFVSAPVAPTIAVQPVGVSIYVGESASFSATANGTAPLAYQWYKDSVAIGGATTNSHGIATATLADAGSYTLVVTNASGSVTSAVAVLTVSAVDADLFKIIRLTASNAVVVDPLNFAGDDRGGLVATDQKIYLRGDDSVGSFDLGNLSGGIRLGTNFGALTNFFIYDSLVSDLRSQKAYVLSSGGTNILGISGGTVTQLIELHGSNGVPTGTTITLSSSIPMAGAGLYTANVGIFSGWGRIVLHNGTNAYSINTGSGTVTDLGAMTRPTRMASESWAYWGVAEYWGGSHYTVYARDATSIVRTRIPDGATTVVSSFSNLNDLANFTVVPGLNRWYFHNESVNQFTNYNNYGAEVLGYADAAFLYQAPQATIVSQPQSLTVTVGSSATFSVSATAVATLSYQWKTNGVALAGANGSSVTFPNAQLTDSGLVFSVTVMDGGDPIDSANATLTVLPNAAPTLTVPANFSVNEDAGSQTNFVTAISAGAAHESGQTLTVTATSDNPALTGPLTVSYASGTATIRYTNTANAFGLATITVIVSDNGGTLSGGVDSATNSYTVTVIPVNDAPSATRLTNNVVVLEDVGSTGVAGFLSAISPGPGETQNLSVSVANNNSALFLVPPALDLLTGNLTFTPAANAFGSATVTYILSDDGGTANGGVDASTNTFTITVVGVNDAPTLALGVTTVNVLTNAGAFTTNIAPVATVGPASETNSQTIVGYVTSNDNNALFSVQPTLGLNGNLNFAVSGTNTGTALVSVQAQDSGDSLNGGTNRSAVATVTITVSGPNQAPTFTLATNNLVVAEDSGNSSIIAFLFGLSAGEVTQSVTNLTTSNNNSNLFSAQPVISGGTLTFTPAANANGSATVTVSATDDGSSPATGTQTFTITVTPVNDAPSFALNSAVVPVVLAEDAGAQSLALAVTNILAGPANESAQTVAFITSNTASNLFSAQPVISSAGTLTFTPAANAFGVITVSATLVDSGGAPGVSNSAAQTFTITITNVNDAPAIAFATNSVVVLEDAGAQSSAAFLSLSPGPFSESGTVSLISVANNNNALFSSQPAFTGSTLTFTPAADANGSATVTVIAQDDTGLFSTDSFTLTVLPVNDAPSLTVTNLVITVLTNSGGFSGQLGATINFGAANETNQAPASFLITNNNNALFTTQPSANQAGFLSFSVAPGQVGTATLYVRVQDTGGTANGGVDVSAPPVLVTVNVTPGNSAPSFTLATNALTVLEDSGSFSGGGFLTALSPGAQPFESGQLVTVTTFNSNSNLFSAQPVISGGTLTFTPAANAFGSATVTVTATDNGTPALSSSQTVTITVTLVNDQPGFALQPGPTGPAGASWTARESNRNWYSVASSAEGSKLAAVVRGGQIYTSSDAGATWTARESNRNWYSIASSADGNKLVAVVSGGQIYTSTDSGATWVAGESNRSWVFVASSSNGDKLVAAVSNGQIYTSTDSGATWTARESSRFWLSVASSADGSSLAAVVYGGQIYTSTDSGATWTARESSRNWLSVASSSNGSMLVAGVDSGQLYISTDSGVTWVARESNRFWSAVASSADGSIFVAAAFGGQLYTSTDSGATWTARESNRNWFSVASSSDGSRLVASSYGTQIYTSVGIAAPFSVTVAEDSGAYSAANAATNISVGPVNESAQSLAFITSNTASNLFSAQPVIAANGTLSFTPAANANGSATVTVYAQDSGGTANGGVDATATQTFTITLTPVNDPPTVTLATNLVAVLEDSGPYGFGGFATFTLPVGETGSVTNVIVSNNNSNLFAVQPSVSLGGALTFTPAANANGSAVVTIQAQDDGGTTGGGQNLSAAQTFTITVTAVNDAPVFTLSTTTVNLLEDAGAQTVTLFATNILGGLPADEAAQNVTFVISNDSSNKFTQLPAINGLGVLTFTLAPNANGTIVVSVVAQDNGGTNNGGINTSAPQFFGIVVTPVNDAPSVSYATNNVVVLEDSGPAGFPGFATFFLPADEAGQTVTNVAVANNNNALFAAQPSIGLDGSLIFTPAANAFGSAVVSVVATDNGGTDNGGQNTSVASTFTVTVTAVNDAPGFNVAVNPVGVLEDSGAATVPNAVTNISAGPGGESQSVAFLTSNSASNLFTSIGQPVIGAGGTLTFTPAANANGAAVLTITAQDTGGTNNGGLDTSSPQTLTILITNINDAPLVTFATNNLVRLEDSGAYAAPGFATFSAPADELAQSLVGYTVSNSSNSLFSIQPAIANDGTLTFVPAANAFGVATITVIAQDDGGTANGGVDRSTNTFTLTLTGVNDAPTLALPFSYVYVETNSGGFTTNLAPVVTAGPANESAQTITDYTVSNNQPGFFTIQPYVLPNGDLNFTLANNVSGIVTLTLRARDSGGTNNGGVDLSAPVTFTIYVGVFNVAPTFTFATNNVTVLEDSGAQTFAGQVANISPGETGLGQNVALTTGNNNPALFSVQPSIAADGTLTFTPVADAFGSATVTVIAADSGLPALFTTNTFTLTITPVNDAPGFALATNALTVLEDAGAQTNAAFATSLSAGPANESGQVLSFIVTNTNPERFDVQPAIDAAGTLTFTPGTNRNSSATVTVYLQDDGGTNNGGVDLAGPLTFTISLTPVNDPPTITFNTNNLVVLEDSGAFSGGFATFATPPSNEGGQSITNVVTSNNSSNLFSVQPTISTAGVLTFTPATNANGSATVTVIAEDDGGTDNGGVNLATNTFTITVTAVNDAPSFALSVGSGSGSGSGSGGSVVGSLYAWGYNLNGRLGDGTTTDRLSPVAIGAAAEWSYVEAGAAHSVGVKTNGTLWAWGGNGNGQLGDGTTTERSSPVQVGVATNWRSVAAGHAHNAAIKDDGTLWTWGWNFNGGLGDGTTTDHYSPVQVGTATDWQAVSAGRYHTVALKTNGTLWVWGRFAEGQLGNGAVASQTTPVQLGTATNWRLVVAGQYSTYALKTDGTLWAWGYNAQGQLGDGTTTQRDTPVQIGTDTDWQSLSAYYFHVLAVKTGGTLWAWGDNGQGQLGDGTTTQRLSPVQIGTDTDWQAVSAGGYHSLAVKTGGTLWAWGDNFYGQVGDSTIIQRNSPVQIGTATDWQLVAGGEFHSLALAGTTVGGSGGGAPAITVAEGSGAYTLALAATNILAGPADESGQVVSFVVTNDNNSLFTSQPAISTAGTLTFTPAPNANGSATVTVYAQDNGGILNGGVDIAGPQAFTITVTPVNDAPSAAFASNPLEVMKNSAPTNIAGFATFSKGPADESSQSITNVTVSNDNAALFDSGGEPTISLAGALNFKPAAGAVGTATVTVVTEDNGGTANGGVNRGTNTFVIRVVSAKIYVEATAAVAAGNSITVPVSILADGDENGVGFTLTFDSALLTFSSISAESGLTLVPNSAQAGSGLLGVVLSKPTDNTFSGGYNPMVYVTFTVATSAPATNTTVGFSSAVAYQQVTDKNANNIPYVAYTPNVVTITALAVGLEGDVTPRPTGNGSVTVSDAVQIGRFAAGLDTITNFGAGSEFQRADAAPLGTQGDGRVTVADWVQTLRFAAGLDTPGAAGGPTVQATSVRTTALAAGARTVRVVGGNLVAGRANTVSIQLDAQGNESGLSLSLAFDASALTFVSATTGSGASSGSLMVNSVKAAAGKVGLVLVLPAGSTIAAGTRDIVTLTFNVTGSGATAIGVTGDSPVAREVADVNANVLGASFVGGSFNIILPVGLKAAGMERAADGSLRLVVRNSDGTPVTAAQAAKYVVHVTSNLGGAWTVLPNALVVENGALKIVDPAAGGAGLRLYKLVETP